MKIKLFIIATLTMALSGCYTMIDPPLGRMVIELDSLDVMEFNPGNVEGDYTVNIHNDEYYSYDRYYQDPQHYRYNSWGRNYYWDPYYYNDRYYGRDWRWHHGHYTRGYERGGYGGGGGYKSPKVKKSRRDADPYRRPPVLDKDDPVVSASGPAGQKVSPSKNKPKPPESGSDGKSKPKSEQRDQMVEKVEKKSDNIRAEKVRKPRRVTDKPRAVPPDVKPVPDEKERSQNSDSNRRKTQ